MNKPAQLEEGWIEILKEEWPKKYMADLISFLVQERKGSVDVYPPKEQVFNSLNTTPYDKVKVVLLGQDPYHGPSQAHGLSFSVPRGVRPPPSLKNIFKELKEDLHIPEPVHGCLMDWAKQGVLLLNTVLTVRAGSPKSHASRGWEEFTDAVVARLCERKDRLIFVLWGKSAQEKCRSIIEKSTQPHFVLLAPHPSPYSAYSGFFGCRHFSKINEMLKRQGKEPINWEIA